MLLLLTASVGLPVAALAVLGIMEWSLGDKNILQVLQRAGLDLCNVSLGILGGIFLNAQLEKSLGQAAPVVAVTSALVEIALVALVLGFHRRSVQWGDVKTTYCSLFAGVFAAALPSILLLWFGGN